MTESLPPTNEPNPQPAPKGTGRMAMELVLKQIEVERELLKLRVNEAIANSPDKEPFDPDALATIYPMDPSRLSEAAIDELRTKYYLFFPGNTLGEYAEHLIYHDTHDSN